MICTSLLLRAVIANYSVAYAHGTGGNSIDLTLPFHMYVLGSALSVAVSFLIIGFFVNVRTAHASTKMYDITRISIIKKILSNRILAEIGKLGVVLTTVVLVLAGFFGYQYPTQNILITFVWVIFGVGMTYFSMLIGNIWPVVHPAIIVLQYGERIFGVKKNVQSLPTHFGVWIAVLLLFVYRWVENIFGHVDHPRSIAFLVCAYLLLSLGGMWFFGKRNWLERADPFHVFFKFLSFFAIFESRDEKIFLRFPGVGLLNVRTATISEIAFVMLMLSTIAYDGLKETLHWQSLLHSFVWIGFTPKTLYTLSMVLLTFFFTGIYFVVGVLVELFSGREEKVPMPFGEFLFSFLPIAVGYELAHYISLFLTEAQRIIPLMSDPLGFGWNIFGTAYNRVNLDIINADILWRSQVLFIVIGHIFSVYIAHIIALRLYKNHKMALASQIPMLVLMVGYTIFSLWIIAQPTG